MDFSAFIANKMSFCVIDTETTGLYPANGDRICELALIFLDEQLNPQEEFESLINPQRAISPEAYQVNRIGADELATAPLFEDLAEKLGIILKDRILIGHNIPFDYGFLKNEYRLCGQDYRAPFLLDTRDIARELLKSSSYGLSTLVRILHVPMENRHRAMGDCRATYEVLRRLYSSFLGGDGHDLGSFLKKFAYDPEQPLADLPEWLKTALSRQQAVLIEYLNRNNDSSSRIIQPLNVFKEQGRIYIEAFCRSRQAKRTFVLERVQSATIVNK